MAKDRNTMAKRQREVEKREKAARKLEKKETRKRERDKETGDSGPLDEGETQVLRIFKRFLMAPGQMLCLANSDIIALLPALDRLIGSGFLEAEKFKGSYSLTQSGYHLMKLQD